MNPEALSGAGSLQKGVGALASPIEFSDTPKKNARETTGSEGLPKVFLTMARTSSKQPGRPENSGCAIETKTLRKKQSKKIPTQLAASNFPKILSGVFNNEYLLYPTGFLTFTSVLNYRIDRALERKRIPMLINDHEI